jgi:hypothetical protein
MANEPQTLFGFPVVITDAAPKDKIILGPMPTWLDLLEHGSWEAYIKAKRKEFGVITNLDDSHERHGDS